MAKVIRKRKLKSKAIFYEQALGQEDLERVRSKFVEFMSSVGIIHDEDFDAYEHLKEDILKIFEMDMFFEAMNSDLGIGYILGTLVTLRALRAQDILDEKFEFIDG